MDKINNRKVRIDLASQLMNTADMDPKHKRIEELLAIARDITTRTIGEAHPHLVEAVFQHLNLREERELNPSWADGVPTSPMH